MNKEQIWREFVALPPDRQLQVADFIAFLRTRSGRQRHSTAAHRPPLADEPFIGMWRDHPEMQNSHAWVRGVRAREWTP